MHKYINHFFSLKCARDIMSLFIGSHTRAAKEVTESFAMYRAVIDHLKINTGDYDVVCVVVGDGVTPRTASLFCHMTRWLVYSIDPEFNLKTIGQYFQEKIRLGNKVKRLFIRKKKIEDLKIDCKGKRVVMVFPHSHAPLHESFTSVFNYSRLDAVALPCCFQIPFKYKSTARMYYDMNVWSPKNVMHVWENLRVVADRG